MTTRPGTTRAAGDHAGGAEITAGAVRFLTAHGRLLDRRRLDVLLAGPGRRERAGRGLLAALEAYGTADGGFGWGLEPDLRAPESQPAAAMHALEALDEAVTATGPAPTCPAAERAVALLDQVGRAAGADGALPFAVPVADPTACAPFWTGEFPGGPDPAAPSLQMTAQVAAQAHRIGRHRPAVAAHPWLAAATAWCAARIERIDSAPHALELSSAVKFLDAAIPARPGLAPLLEHLSRYLPRDRPLPVEGGIEGEVLHPLDVSPWPGQPSRALLDDALVTADLDRLTRDRRDDGGWAVPFTSYSPAAELEWRGYATVGAVAVLRAHGRL